MNTILTIAGLDPSGNAGILRDSEILHSRGSSVAAVVTALTAQSRRKFFSADPVDPKIFQSQLEALGPLSQFAAIKIGMLGNEQIAKSLVGIFRKEKKLPPIVLDPVLESTSGGILLTAAGRKVLWKELLPLVSLWTPNLAEAEFFWGKKIKNEKSLEKAVVGLWAQNGVPILIKGLKKKNSVTDLYYDGSSCMKFAAPRLKRLPVRGTGCALSSLIASQLATGSSVEKAVKKGRFLFDKWLEAKVESSGVLD